MHHDDVVSFVAQGVRALGGLCRHAAAELEDDDHVVYSALIFT